MGSMNAVSIARWSCGESFSSVHASWNGANTKGSSSWSSTKPRYSLRTGTCVRPQTRKRNHPRHREMATSRLNEVKAPQHFKTPSPHFFHRVALLLGHHIKISTHKFLHDRDHAVGHAVALLRDLGADGGRDGGGGGLVGFDLRLLGELLEGV